jgi:outer membrane protein
MKNIKLNICLVGLIFFGKIGLFGQDSWTLERAIRHAQETNLGIQQSKIGVRQSESNLELNKAARNPNLNGATGLGVNSGRYFDQSAGQIITSTSRYNTFSLSTGLALYQGGAIKNSIAQGKLDVQAAKADADEAANNIGLSVAQAYLQILLSEEQVEISKKRMMQTEEQLKRTDRLIAVGTLAQNERLNLVAQLARDEGALVTAQNQVDLSYLNLKNILQIEPDAPFKIVRPLSVVPLDANPDIFSLKSIYTGALGTQPQIRAGEIREQSAIVAEKIARAGYLPSVNLGADVSTRWASQIKDATYGDVRVGAANPVEINGFPAALAFFQPDVSFNSVKYLKQLNRNFGLGVGVQVNVPILQNGRTRANVQRAQLAFEQTKIANNQTKQRLKNDIQTAIANSKAAKRSYETSIKTVAALRAAFENTQKRFDLGSMTALDLTTAKTNFDNAESELLISKYDYILKLKVIDFYQGRKLSLD